MRVYMDDLEEVVSAYKDQKKRVVAHGEKCKLGYYKN